MLLIIKGRRPICNNDEKGFKEITDFLFSKESQSKNGRTNSLLIVQNGEIVFEQYNDPVSVTTKQVSWSMAKSFIGALTGIMIDKGLISSVEENKLLPNWNDKRKFISIDDLLNMKSGLNFLEEYDTSGRSDTLEMLYGQGKLDQASFAASFPMKTINPGMEFNYSTGETNILSKIIKLKLEEAGLNYLLDRHLMHYCASKMKHYPKDSFSSHMFPSHLLWTYLMQRVHCFRSCFLFLL